MSRTATPGSKKVLVQLLLDKEEVEQLKAIQASHKPMDVSLTQIAKLCIRRGIEVVNAGRRA